MELDLEALAATLLLEVLKRENPISAKILEIFIRNGVDTSTACKILLDLSKLGESEGGKDD